MKHFNAFIMKILLIFFESDLFQRNFFGNSIGFCNILQEKNETYVKYASLIKLSNALLF